MGRLIYFQLSFEYRSAAGFTDQSAPLDRVMIITRVSSGKHYLTNGECDVARRPTTASLDLRESGTCPRGCRAVLWAGLSYMKSCQTPAGRTHARRQPRQRLAADRTVGLRPGFDYDINISISVVSDRCRCREMSSRRLIKLGCQSSATHPHTWIDSHERRHVLCPLYYKGSHIQSGITPVHLTRCELVKDILLPFRHLQARSTYLQ